MDQIISPALVQGLGAVGILIAILVGLIVSFRTGAIYTKSQHDEIVNLHKEAIKEGIKREEKWQAVADTWQKAAQEAINGNEANLEQGKTIIALVQSLPRSQRR